MCTFTDQAWLFGSWAQGRALPGSDVDLLLVYRGAPRPDLHRLVRRAFPGLPVEPHAYTEKEAEALAQGPGPDAGRGHPPSGA
jgi:predicted nucleotidyltransferase